MNLLYVSEIRKQIEDNVILNGISFDMEGLQKIAITGETGSGKSTLLKIISGLDQADSGTVFFEHQRVKGLQEKLMPGHPGIAYLSQSYNLRKRYRVEELLAYANDLSTEESERLYTTCRIRHLLQRETTQLSGGEQQRVAIAVLLTTRPGLLVLDEPFSNLDLIHKNLLKSVIHDIGASMNISCMMASHDPADTLSWADRIMVMHEGRIIQSGSPEEVYLRPVNTYVAGLFGSYNLLSPKQLHPWKELTDKPSAGKRVFIRPEQFGIIPGGINTVKGIIRKRIFGGSYYEADVAIGDLLIHIRITGGCPAVGSEISLCFDGDADWYLPG